MRLEKRKFSGVLILIGLSLAGLGHAATIVAKSTSLSHVQAAINEAATGDIVSIPAGNSIWASSVSVPNNKKLRISGQGIGITIIDRNSVSSLAMSIGASGSTVGSIEFRNGYVAVDGLDWRVHHCKFDNGSNWGEGVYSSSQSVPAVHTRGVVDHCTFINSRVCINGNAYLLSENGNQHKLWSDPVTFGGPDFLFVEDCNFSGDGMIDCIDSRFGGRYVFRYNTYTDTKTEHNGYMCETHTVRNDQGRASRAWEIYENHIFSTAGMWAGIGYLRGGTGVCFNNTVTGSTQMGVVLNNDRDTLDEGGVCKKCDGTSLWDENVAGEMGWMCRDQIGAGRDSSLWTPSNPYPSQAHEPAYFWGNMPSTIGINFPSTPGHIVEGRDYYNRGIARPGYTPYTYPHPLTMTSGTQVPQSPTGLHIKN